MTNYGQIVELKKIHKIDTEKTFLNRKFFENILYYK